MARLGLGQVTLLERTSGLDLADVRARAADGRTLEASGVPAFAVSNTNPWTFLGPLPVVTNPRNSFDVGLGGVFSQSRLSV